MALKLTVEQAPAYCMTDAQAREAAEAGKARRQRARRPKGEGEAVPVSTVNQVAKLLHAGQFRAEHVRAAEEIAHHWYAVTRALHARSGLYAERIPRGADVVEHPADSARTKRYLAWANWADVQAVTPAVSLVTLTLDLAVDGYSIEQIRIRRAVSHRLALRLLQVSLWGYAAMAGWAQQHPQRAA